MTHRLNRRICSGMEPERTRRSDRLGLELRILVSGVDAEGREFAEESKTLVIGGYGAKIALARNLAPQQELWIRCLGTGKQAAARVIGEIGEGSEGRCYGIEMTDPDVRLWGIEFPPLSESDKAVARALLECSRCHNRGLVYLNEFEVEVFDAHRSLWRPCKQCGQVRLWNLAETEAPSRPPPVSVNPSAQAEPNQAASLRAQDQREHLRLSLRMKAYIRTPHSGEEVIVTDNVSRGGFSFVSRRSYGVGNVLEVSVPYSPGAANIFSPARIVRVEDLPDEGMSSYGVAYIPATESWPRN